MSRPRFLRWFASSRVSGPSDAPPANQPSVCAKLSCFEALEDRTTPAALVPVAQSGATAVHAAPAVVAPPYTYASPYQTNPVTGSLGTYGLAGAYTVGASVGAVIVAPGVVSTSADQTFLSLAAQNEILSFIVSTGAAQRGTTAATRQFAQQTAALDVQLLGSMVSLMDPANAAALSSRFLQEFETFGITGARGTAATQQFLALNAQLQTMNVLLFQSEARSNSGSPVQAFAISALPEVQFQFQSAIRAQSTGARTTTTAPLTTALTSELSALTTPTMTLPTATTTSTSTSTTTPKPSPTHTPAFPSSGTTSTSTSPTPTSSGTTPTSSSTTPTSSSTTPTK